MKAFHAVPLFVFLIFCIMMVGLLFNQKKMDLIERPVPPLGFELPSHASPVLVNFFASWCVPCRAEHQQISDLAKMHGIKVYGVAYKDKKEDVQKYLTELGNPYEHIIYDDTGSIFIDWGLAGVPETIVVYNNKIRYRHEGPVMPDDVHRKILQVMRDLR